MACCGQLLVGILREILAGVVAIQRKIGARKVAQRAKVQLSGDIGARSFQGDIQASKARPGERSRKCLDQRR
jgi:hypothetical protein